MTAKPVAYVRNLTDAQPHAVTSLKYRSAADVEAGVEYVPVYAAPTLPDADGEAFRTAARLGLTLRFVGGCAQSSAPGSPCAYEVSTLADPAAAMRDAIARAASVIESTNGEPN